MPCHTCNGPLGSAYDYRAELDEATRVACNMRKILKRHGLEGELDKEARCWVESHDRIDAQHEKEERERARRRKLKRQAESKLTQEELKAIKGSW